jgi:hypothetical protein
MQKMFRRNGRARSVSWGRYRFALQRQDLQGEAIGALRGSEREMEIVIDEFAVSGSAGHTTACPAQSVQPEHTRRRACTGTRCRLPQAPLGLPRLSLVLELLHHPGWRSPGEHCLHRGGYHVSYLRGQRHDRQDGGAPGARGHTDDAVGALSFLCAHGAAAHHGASAAGVPVYIPSPAPLAHVRTRRAWTGPSSLSSTWSASISDGVRCALHCTCRAMTGGQRRAGDGHG